MKKLLLLSLVAVIADILQGAGISPLYQAWHETAIGVLSQAAGKGGGSAVLATDQVKALVTRLGTASTVDEIKKLQKDVFDLRKQLPASEANLKVALFDLEGGFIALQRLLSKDASKKAPVDVIYLVDIIPYVRGDFINRTVEYIKQAQNQMTLDGYILLLKPAQPQGQQLPEKSWQELAQKFQATIRQYYSDIGQKDQPGNQWDKAAMARYWHYAQLIWDVYGSKNIYVEPKTDITKYLRWVSGRLVLVGLIKQAAYVKSMSNEAIMQELYDQLCFIATVDGCAKQIAMLQAIPPQKKSQDIQQLIADLQNIQAVIAGTKQPDVAKTPSALQYVSSPLQQQYNGKLGKGVVGTKNV